MSRVREARSAAVAARVGAGLLCAILCVATLQAETSEPHVTLKVKDEDVRAILGSMQEQCGIRNLIIDPDVKGTGTFYFRELECDKAFRVVLRTLGLSSEPRQGSLLHVRTRRR
jgi:type II secretory pathway component GspD/PulD (secretin)